MESIYWQLKLFRSLSAKTRHATYSVILSLLICLFFILGYYFDWGAPLDVLSLVFAPVVEIYLAIKAMTAFQAKRILVTMIYALTLGFVVTVLGIAGASNGQARSFAARIFVLKNYKQLERQIESAQKKVLLNTRTLNLLSIGIASLTTYLFTMKARNSSNPRRYGRPHGEITTGCQSLPAHTQ